MTTLDKLTQDFIDQGKDDCFGIWEVIDVIKEELLIHQEPELQRLTMKVVRELLRNGLQAGESPYVAGDFIPWSVQDSDQVLHLINKEWDDLGHEPNIPDVVWFGKPKT